MQQYLTIRTDFSYIPGPGKRTQGKFSGEEFLERILIPKIKNCLNSNCQLIIDLDGTTGYGVNFLQTAFGGLIQNRIISLEDFTKMVTLISDEEPYLIDEIKNYMQSYHF